MKTQQKAPRERRSLPLLGHQIAGVTLGVSLVTGLLVGPYLVIQIAAFGLAPASWKGIGLISWFLWAIATAIASIRAMRRSEVPSEVTMGLIVALLSVTTVAMWLGD